MGTQPARGSAVGHQCEYRVSYRGISTGHQLLGIQERHAPPHDQVQHRELRDELQSPHEVDCEQLAPY